MKRFVLAMLAVAAIVAVPKAADASIIIDFGVGSASGGTYTCTATDCATTVPISFGVMKVSFDSGATFTSYGTSGTGTDTLDGVGDGAAVLTFDTAAASPNFVMTGGVPSLGLTGPVALLSGTITSWSNTQTGAFWTFTADGTDVKNQSLLRLLGIDVNTPFVFGGYNLSSQQAGGGFNVFSADIPNTSVPEPGSMLLLGTGLLGLAAVARRRLRKA